MTRLVIEGCAIATVDGERSEHREGHIVVRHGFIDEVGAGPAPVEDGDEVRIDGRGMLATPGLINCHHHLYQWATRGLAYENTLFEWLQTLYPVWAFVDEAVEQAAARAGLVALARSGCTTVSDHHYLFPHDGGDLLGVEIEAAREVGLRFHPCRGSMDLGRSSGGLPPDEVVEDRDAILQACNDAIDRHHDPSPDAMVRIALAPCSPFSVTQELMREAAELARRSGVRLHTHLAETVEEEAFCRERFGCRPVEYLESLGWLGDDVWFAHCVHVSESEIGRLGATGTGVAHCPGSNARLGAGIAPAMAMVVAGVPVGLGVDGAASNEAASLVEELRHSVLFARAVGGPQALTVRDGLELATLGGARVLGWDDQIGSLEPGKLADLALWRLDTAAHVNIPDPVAALVLGSAPPLELLLVQGRPVVRRDALVTVDEERLAVEVHDATDTLLTRAVGR